MHFHKFTTTGNTKFNRTAQNNAKFGVYLYVQLWKNTAQFERFMME